MNTPEHQERPRPEHGLGHYLRDIVNGACDGVVTTLAVIAGATGAEFEPRVSIVLGIVNLAADGLSMGASNYLGLKSELEQRGQSVSHEAPSRHGLATALAFVVAGGIPLLAFALTPRAAQFETALGLAFATLAIVGGARSRFTQRPAVRCAFEMVAVAGGASAIAYLLGFVGGSVAALAHVREICVDSHSKRNIFALYARALQRNARHTCCVAMCVGSSRVGRAHWRRKSRQRTTGTHAARPHVL